MKFLRNLVERGRKLYHAPDAPLHKVWPLIDAQETFLFAPDTKTQKRGPHVRDYIDLKRVMFTVIVALVPCLLFAIYNTGYQHFAALARMAGDGAGPAYVANWMQALVLGSDYAPNVAQPGFLDIVLFGLSKMLPILVVSYVVGLTIEGFFAVIRKEEISEGYLVTGILIALIVPASIPLWQLALSVAFSVILVKEVFGGTGMNIFNVALMSRAFLFFAYPAQISGDLVWVAGNGKASLIDGYSGATPLLAAANYKPGADPAIQNAGDAVAAAGYDLWELFVGLIPGSVGETSKLCILLGAAYLLITGVASWRTMLGGLIGLLATGLLFNLTLSDLSGMPSLPWWEHLFMGGFLFALVFMATDPVSSPDSHRGRWIYGILIGVVTVLVRAINPAYPEGAMLSVLLLNAFAPTIDHFVVASSMKRRKVRLG